MKNLFFSPKPTDPPPDPPPIGGGDPHARYVVHNHKTYGRIKVPVMTHYKGRSKRSKDQPVPKKCTYKVMEIKQEDGSIFLGAYDVQPK